MLLAGDKKPGRALVASFKDTDKYKDELSKSMRDQYARHLRVIEEAWGDDPVRALTAPEIQQVIDTAFKGTPQAGRVFRSTLIVLINHGIPRGYRDDNPAEKTEKAGKSTSILFGVFVWILLGSPQKRSLQRGSLQTETSQSLDADPDLRLVSERSPYMRTER